MSSGTSPHTRDPPATPGLRLITSCLQLSTVPPTDVP
jgi:hypothetical protein